jgi:hypothetical protein
LKKDHVFIDTVGEEDEETHAKVQMQWALDICFFVLICCGFSITFTTQSVEIFGSVFGRFHHVQRWGYTLLLWDVMFV